MPQNIQLRRSLSNTPATLLYGQPAWSDSVQNFYIGTSAGTPILINNVKAVSASIGQLPVWNGTTYVNSSLLTIGQNGYSIATRATNALDWLNYSATNSNASYPSIEFKRANGTIAAPTPSQLNGITGGLKFIAEDAFTAAPGFVHAEFYAVCRENQTSTASGSEFRFRTTANGTKTLTDVFFIENDGTLSVRSQTNYELKVTAPTDIPNKKYVDDNNNLQTTYNNSTISEITTNATLGALTLRRGSAVDTDKVLEVTNGGGTPTFEVQGNGVSRIKTAVNLSCFSLEPLTGLTDPNIAIRPARLFVEATKQTTSDALRLFFNDGGNPNLSGYITASYNGTAPEINLIDMDDDPSYITFSIARIGLTLPGPGTFAAPVIVSKFGGRQVFGVGTTGFSWQSNGGVSGGAVNEFMACDSNFLSIPSRITAARPLGVNGMIGYNSTLNKVEAFENGAWTQFVDTTTNQTIAGNKVFTGRIQANTDVQQIFNASAVTTTSNVFAVITGLTITTASPIISTYRLSTNLNIRNSTSASTIIEIQIFVNGVADATTLVSYAMNTNTSRVFVPIDKIYVNAAVGTVYTVQWRRVSGSATPTITNKTFILQEIL